MMRFSFLVDDRSDPFRSFKNGAQRRGNGDASPSSDGGAETIVAASDAATGLGGDRLDGVDLMALQPNWMRWVGPLVSAGILAAALWQLREIDVRTLARMLPRTAAFWSCFAACFAVGPVSEWIIFRRLWRLPASGFLAVLRKIVGSNLLLGYAGEAYFYAWARERTMGNAAPFGAVKDVAVLSALTGNVATLVLTVAAMPILTSMRLRLGGATLTLPVSVVVLSSLAILLLRRRLFSLRSDELRFVAALHILRIVVSVVLVALLWHLIVPSVTIGWWLLLAALRQLVSRLPLVPNKDVVFAGVVAALLGPAGGVPEAVTLVASLTLLANLVVGGALGLAGVADVARRFA